MTEILIVDDGSEERAKVIDAKMLKYIKKEKELADFKNVSLWNGKAL